MTLQCQGAFLMRSAVTILVCASFLLTIATRAGAQVRAEESTFQKLLSTRYEAIARGDSATVHRQIAADMHWVIGANGASINAVQFLAAVSHPQVPAPRFDIDSLRARIVGTVATISYRRLDRRVSGATEVVDYSRALEVFVRRGADWILLEHSQTWVVQSPQPVTLDSATLNAFVGRYEVGPGFVDNVHWEGGHLVATSSTESQGATLVPVSASAFSPNGIAPLIVFERDASGRVVGYVQESPDGVVRRTHRLP
jgi:hypothetical protein